MNMILYMSFGHLMEFPIVRYQNVRWGWIEMQSDSTVMNGMNIAQVWRCHCWSDTHDVFSWHEGRRWTCTPHPFLQQKVHHVIIRKLPKPKVTLFHACTISLFIISEMQNWSWLAWFQSSYLQMLITLDITDSTTATPYSKLHATVKWVMNVQSNLEERVFCKPLNFNVFHKHRSKFTIRNARHNLRHCSLNFYMKVDALIA